MYSIPIHIFTDKPGPPQGPIGIQSITKTSATFSWSPPVDDGGSPIQNYHVQIRESARTAWQPLGSSLLSNFTAKNLKDNAHYVMRVTAENQYGVSTPLEIREAILVKSPFGECLTCGCQFEDLYWIFTNLRRLVEQQYLNICMKVKKHI